MTVIHKLLCANAKRTFQASGPFFSDIYLDNRKVLVNSRVALVMH